MSQVQEKPIPQGLAAHLGNIVKQPAVAENGGIPVPNEPEPEAPAPAPVEAAPIPTPTEAPAEVEAQTEPAPAEEPSEGDSWLTIEESTPTATGGGGNDPKAPSIEDKAKAFDALFQNPEVELVLKAFQAGKTLADLAQEYQVVDYSKMDAEAVTKIFGQQNGYTDEDMQEWLDSLPKIQRDREIQKMRADLDKDQREKTGKLLRGYEMSAEQEQAVQVKFDTDVARVATSMVDKDLFGAKLTKKDADDFSNWVRTEFMNYIKPDGTYNVELLRNFWVGAVKIPAIQKANYAKGKSEGAQEVLKEVHRPNLTGAAVTRLPQTKPVVDEHEKATKAAQAIGKGLIKPILTN